MTVPDGPDLVIGDYRLRLPPDHRLPAIRAAMPSYDAHLGWIIREIARDDPAGTFIDIGANIGDTAALLRSHAPNPLLCVEGAAALLPWLRANLRLLPGPVACEEAFVAVAEIAAFGLNYRSGSGSGGFGLDPAAAAPARFTGVADLLAAASRGGIPPALFKTDTDGLDGFILRDYLRLGEDRAVLFFECDEAGTAVPGGDAAWAEVFSQLHRRGYALLIYDNHGLPMLFADPTQGTAVDDLRFYVARQHAEGAVRIHYLDIWAFPPAKHRLFTDLRAERGRRFF